MKATKAYIASLGTTGVLLAASILMLAVVSAVVAFNAWPGDSVSSPTPTVVLAQQSAAIRVSTRSLAPSAIPSTRRNAAAAGPAARSVVVARGVLGQRVSGGHLVTGTSPAKPTAPGPLAPVAKPLQGATSPIIYAVSNPGSAVSQIADSAQQTTASAGLSLAKIDPQVGEVVTEAGALVAETVRNIPLPQHLVPGH